MSQTIDLRPAPDGSSQQLARIESAPPAPMFGGVNIEALLEKAVDAKSAVEVLERLATMRREMRAEAAKEAFDSAMAAFQAECPIIRKDARVSGGKFSYNYAPLDSIVNQTKTLIQKHGFSYRVTAEVNGPEVKAICRVIHSLGHSEESSFQVPIDPTSHMNQAQKFASALTFAKRYALCNAFGILTGDQDDDAGASDPEHAAGQGKRTEYQRAAPPARQAATAPTPPAPKEKAPSNPVRYPTEATRLWAIKELTSGDPAASEAKRTLVTEFLRKAGCLLPTENLEDWPLQYVPSSKEDLGKLLNALGDFENGLPAKMPYHHGAAPAPEPEPAAEKPKAKANAAPKPAAPIEVPRDPDAGDQSTAPTTIDPTWERVSGKVEFVKVKSGTSGRGPWTSYGVKMGEQWYNSFSKRLGGLAQTAQKDGFEVDLYYSVDGRGGKIIEQIEA